MTTRLSDLITHDNWAPWFDQYSTQNSALVQSGIVTRTDEFDQMALASGLTHNMPFYDDLPDTAPNKSSDDPAVTSTPDGITTGQDVATKCADNQSWSSMDLNVSVNHEGDDPVQRIFRKIGGYWLRSDQQYLISSITGVFADNITNDASDLVHDVTLAADPTLSAANFIDALQLLGDAKERITALVVHSAVETVMAKADLITTIPDSEGKAMIKFFMGKRLIVDDTCPVSGADYTSYAFAEGAFAWGEGMPKNPLETERIPAAGNGSGQDVLYSRREWILHPRGFKYTGPDNPTRAQLALASSWDRVYDQKLARVVGILSRLS